MGCTVKDCEKKETKMTVEQLIHHLNKECQQLKIHCPRECGVDILRSEAILHYKLCNKIERAQAGLGFTLNST